MKTSTPQFGWYAHGHQAINKKAIAELPDHSWKQFLLENQTAINSHSYFQDLFHPSQHHTIILEPTTMTFSESQNYGQTDKTPNEETWKTIQERYSPEAKKIYMAKAQSKSPKVIPGRHAVFAATRLSESILNILRNIKHQFHDPILKQKLSPDRITLLKPMLVERIGALTHILSDMVVPLHTSNPHNWPLGKDSKWGMHHFLEAAFFKAPEDYQLEPQGYPADNYRPLQDEKDLQKYLCKYVSRAAEKVFRIVDCQKKALDKLPEKTTAQDYEDELIKCMKPIMQEQAHSASKITSRILHSLWVKAGQPDMSVLNAAQEKAIETSAVKI